MLECLAGLILFVIFAVIVLFVFEAVVNVFFTPPPPVFFLIRLLVGLLVLIRAWRCIEPLVGRIT